MNKHGLNIAMLSIHSSPLGKLGTKNTGGMSVYVRELARELGEQDHCVDIFTCGNKDSRESPVIELFDRVRLIHLFNGRLTGCDKDTLFPTLPQMCASLNRFIQTERIRYDIVHSHYWLSGPVGSWAMSCWSIPHLITFHTLGAVKSSLGLSIQEPKERISTEQSLINSCNRILASTKQERDQLCYYYNASLSKIGLVPCGVDLNVFVPIGQNVARNRLGFDRDEVLLLYVGRFDKLKGLDRLLEAVAMVSDHQTFRLIVVGGDGKETMETQVLRDMCIALNIKDQVIFCGSINHHDLPVYYNAADGLVIPSLYESFSLVALEALACGTPVLATKVGALERVIRNGETGLIVDDAESTSLASGIVEFLAWRSRYRPASSKVQESVQQYSWSHAAAALLEEYLNGIQPFSV